MTNATLQAFRAIADAMQTEPTTRGAEIMTTRPLRLTRFGLAEDPTGAHVTLPWTDGRTLLGTVTGYRRDPARDIILLTVRHFNGEPWPVEPTAGAVRILERG